MIFPLASPRLSFPFFFPFLVPIFHFHSFEPVLLLHLISQLHLFCHLVSSVWMLSRQTTTTIPQRVPLHRALRLTLSWPRSPSTPSKPPALWLDGLPRTPEPPGEYIESLRLYYLTRNRDPFTGSSYKYFGMGNQGETAMPMVEQSNQSLTSYLEQAITPHGRNMNFSVATPPTGSVTGRSPTKFPAHGTVYGASTSVVPNSNARDSYGPPRYGSFNPYESPLHNRASFPSLTNERRFLIRNVDTDTEGLEIVQLFQVSHSSRV